MNNDIQDFLNFLQNPQNEKQEVNILVPPEGINNFKAKANKTAIENGQIIHRTTNSLTKCSCGRNIYYKEIVGNCQLCGNIVCKACHRVSSKSSKLGCIECIEKVVIEPENLEPGKIIPDSEKEKLFLIKNTEIKQYKQKQALKKTGKALKWLAVTLLEEEIEDEK